ncbi:MAG TPA: DUF3857 domain-containing protein [candidate division Zixibacteria bacterium]|nr:DUF3857 domain-containing protein [candidate division Zixibacteria bacterium]
MRLATITIIFALIITGALFAVPPQADTLVDTATSEMILNAPGKEDYPEAKLVHLWGEKIIKLDSEGGYTVEWHDKYKVLTFMGRREVSNLKYNFDSSYEEIDLTRARSITPTEDGGFVVAVVESVQINDMTAPGLADAGIYANLKQRVVTVPGVSDSSIVEISGKIETFAQPKKPFGGIEFLAKSDPVLGYHLVIEVPDDRELVYLSANGAPEPKIQGNRYIWEISNWEGMVPEPSGPLGRDILPCVYYSATKSWTVMADLLQAQFSPRAMVGQEILAKSKEIVGELMGVAEIEALASWVADNIRHIDVDINDVGYFPNSATQVLENGYGDSRDRSVLLAALLRARNYNPDFVLLPPRNARVKESVPTLAQFSRMTISVDLHATGRLWFWTEDDYSHPTRLPGYHDEKAFVVSVGKGALLPVPPIAPDENGMRQTYNITLDAKGGISGEMSAEFRGDYGRTVRRIFRDARPRQAGQRVQEIASNLGGGELAESDAFEFSNLEDLKIEPSLSLRFVSDDFAFIQDEIMIFNFPENPVGFAGTSISTSLDERDEPLVLRTPFNENYSFRLNTPPDYKVLWASEPVEFTNEIGRLRVSSEIGDGTVDYNVWLTIEKTWIEPSNYPAIRDLMRAYMAPKNRMVLLEKIQDEPLIEDEVE